MSSDSIAEARTALAAVRADPAPVAELEEVVVRRDGKPLPCEQLLPRAEVVVILGESFKLTFAADARPGVSSCEWKRPTDSNAMAVHVFSEPAFRDEKMSGPVEFFNVETKMAPCAQPPEFLPNLGEQAVICSSGDRFHTVISRRRNDVVVFSCSDCARKDAIALARAAAQ